MVFFYFLPGNDTVRPTRKVGVELYILGIASLICARHRSIDLLWCSLQRLIQHRHLSRGANPTTLHAGPNVGIIGGGDEIDSVNPFIR